MTRWRVKSNSLTRVVKGARARWSGTVSPVFEEPPLLKEFRALESSSDPRRRGPELELLNPALVRRAQFR